MLTGDDTRICTQSNPTPREQLRHIAGRPALRTFIPAALSEESLVPHVSSVVVWLLDVYLTERGKPLARVSSVHSPLELTVQQ